MKRDDAMTALVAAGLFAMFPGLGFAQTNSSNRVVSHAANSVCSALAVNNNGVFAGFCLANTNVLAPAIYANASSNQRIDLPLPPTISACEPLAINDAATPKTIANCYDDMERKQGVAWQGTTNASSQVLAPLAGLLGVTPDAGADPVNLNLQGTVVGYSIAKNGGTTPVVWNAAGVATALPAPLLVPGGAGSSLNCTVAGISSNAAQSIAGTCSAPNTGAMSAVLWTSPTTAYKVLPLPANSTACEAVGINLLGQVAGTCRYANQVSRMVRWAAGGATPPIVMANVNGGATTHSTGTGLNDTGKMLGQYLTANHVSVPVTWDPDAGVNGIGFVSLGGYQDLALAIGNNGNVVVNGENADRHTTIISGNLGSTVQTDIGVSLPTAQFRGASRNGCYAAGIVQTDDTPLAAFITTFTGTGC